MTAALGSQIGQFIERTRAEEATERARRRLTFLAEASRVLSSSLEFDVTLQRITELAVPTLADWCGVSTLDADGQLRQVAIAHVDPEKIRWARELAERYPPDPHSEYGAYAVLRSRESLLMPVISPELLESTARDEEHLRIIQELQARSYMAAPLIVRDHAFGVIAFLTTAESERIYDEEDLSFAEELARRAGIAVENAQLFQRAVQNEEQQRFLADAGSALASSLDYHDTLQRVASLALPAFADWCIVDVLEGDEIHRVAVAARREESRRALEELRRSYVPTLESPQPAAVALRERRPVVFHDFDAASLKATTRDERHYELMEQLGPRSAMALPMIARGHVVGAITFAWAESGRRYTDADLPLAEEIARRAGLAVDNARLHRETEERARAALVLTHVGDGVFMIDSDGIVRLWNPAAEAITGLAASSVLGGYADRVIPGWGELSARIPVAPEPAPAARSAESLPVEISGRELWLSITGVALPEGTVYAFRDLTEERALEKIRSDFVATISHELRTPLASVYGAAVTLIQRDDTLTAEQRARLLGVIASEADRLARIVNDVLLASRLDSQQLVFQIESCDAGAALERSIDAARAHLPPEVEIVVDEGGSGRGRGGRREAAPDPRQPDRERGQVLAGRRGHPRRVRARRAPTALLGRRPGNRHPARGARADLREVLPPRPEPAQRGRWHRPRAVHLTRAGREDARLDLGRVRAGRGIDLLLRAAARGRRRADAGTAAEPPRRRARRSVARRRAVVDVRGAPARRPVAGTGPAVPEDHRQHQADRADDRDDPADGLDVDRRRVRVDREGQDQADGDQDQTYSETHATSFG